MWWQQPLHTLVPLKWHRSLKTSDVGSNTLGAAIWKSVCQLSNVHSGQGWNVKFCPGQYLKYSLAGANLLVPFWWLMYHYCGIIWLNLDQMTLQVGWSNTAETAKFPKVPGHWLEDKTWKTAKSAVLTGCPGLLPCPTALHLSWESSKKWEGSNWWATTPGTTWSSEKEEDIIMSRVRVDISNDRGYHQHYDDPGLKSLNWGIWSFSSGKSTLAWAMSRTRPRYFKWWGCSRKKILKGSESVQIIVMSEQLKTCSRRVSSDCSLNKWFSKYPTIGVPQKQSRDRYWSYHLCEYLRCKQEVEGKGKKLVV